MNSDRDSRHRQALRQEVGAPRLHRVAADRILHRARRTEWSRKVNARPHTCRRHDTDDGRRPGGWTIANRP
jgi:hypothetical protein